jgi:type IV pilus assembly protein PilQ
VHLVIHPSGQFEKLAYQSDDTFSVEFKPAVSAAAQALQPKEKYTGQKISLNFQSIDVRAVLSILADASGKNIVVSDSVNGNITLRLQDVPWDQALDIILRTKGLATREFGNVLMVGTAQEVATQENAEAAAMQSAQTAAPLESAFIQVNYAKAVDIQGLLKAGTGDNSLLSKRGSVSVDARTNTLLVQDTPENISNIRAMVQRLDVAVKQVLIESRIVIANNDFTRDLGTRLGYSGSTQRGGTFMTTTGSAAGADTQVAGAVSGVNFTIPSLAQRLNVNLPAAGASGQIAFAVLRGNSLIDLELSALQSEGQGEVVSSPHVLTADQQLAHIEQGVQIPYQQASSSGATTTSFKSAVLSLDERVIMDLEVHNDSVGQNVPSATGGNVPTIDTRDVKTHVLVSNGDTVVLGGIYETTETTSTSKVPLLGDLPLLGWLFRNTQTVNNKDELLIFVTPKIVDQGATAAVNE